MKKCPNCKMAVTNDTVCPHCNSVVDTEMREPLTKEIIRKDLLKIFLLNFTIVLTATFFVCLISVIPIRELYDKTDFLSLSMLLSFIILDAFTLLISIYIAAQIVLILNNRFKIHKDYLIAKCDGADETIIETYINNFLYHEFRYRFHFSKGGKFYFRPAWTFYNFSKYYQMNSENLWRTSESDDDFIYITVLGRRIYSVYNLKLFDYKDKN